MKYVIVIPEGCADTPAEDLDGCTPLVVAYTPAMDSLVDRSRLGTALFAPVGMACMDDVTLLSLLGYDPAEFCPGWAPLEALGRGSPLRPGAWAIRLSLVTIRDGRIVDHTAGGIGTAETEALLEDLASALYEELGDEVAGLRLIPLTGHRALLVDERDRSFEGLATHAPALLLDRPIRRQLPEGQAGDLMRGIIEISSKCFEDHPINEARTEGGLQPATHAWPWGSGQGMAAGEGPADFPSRNGGLRGLMICSRDLPAGAARLIGWDVHRIDDDLNLEARGDAAIDALGGYDVICVHMAGPDEAAHLGDHEAKTNSLIAMDRHILSPLADWLASSSDARLLIAPSHVTSSATRRHEPGPTPFMMAGSEIEALIREPFTEANAQNADLHIEMGDELMEYFLFGSGIRRWKR